MIFIRDFIAQKWAHVAAILIILGVLSACGNAGGGSGIRIFGGGYDGVKVGNRADDAPKIDLPVGSVCPNVELRAGTETLRLYARGEERTDANLQLQAHIENIARQCKTVGSQTLITVTLGGRAIKGARASSLSYPTQIRIVAIDKERLPIIGDKQDITLSFKEDSSVAAFSMTTSPIILNEIDPITLSGYLIYVGFDNAEK